MGGGHYTAFVKSRKQQPAKEEKKAAQASPPAEKESSEKEMSAEVQEQTSEQSAGDSREAGHTVGDDGNADQSDIDSSKPAGGSLDAGETAKETASSAAAAEVDASSSQRLMSPPGVWYYVSDSHVSMSSEDKVMAAQAYLLFYERV